MHHLTPAVRRCIFMGASLLLGAWFGMAAAADLLTVDERTLPSAVDQRLHAFLAAHKGQAVLINFWASWCQPCQDEMPSLQKLANRYRAKGLVVTTVAVADNARK